MIKKILIFMTGLFLWTAVGAATPSIPSVQETPFGLVELISCTTSLRVNGPLYLGIRITHNDDWQPDPPELTVTTSDGTPAALFTPFKQPYSNPTIYPISAVLNYKPEQPITFQVEGQQRACHQNNCLTTPIRLALTLAPKMAVFTPECAGITLALSNVPIPMYSKFIKAYATLQADNQVQITLDFPRIPRTLTLYDENKNLITPDIQVQKKRAVFTLPNTKDNKIHLFARTYYHYYEIEASVSDQPAPPPPLPLSDITWACVLCFLLSPLPIYLARTTKTTQKKFRKETKTLLILIGAYALYLAVLWFYQSNQTDFGLHGCNNLLLGKTGTLIAMSLGLLFIPASPYLAILFLFITPRPYLELIQNQTSLITLLPLAFLVLTTVLICTIQLIFEKKIFATLQGKNGPKIWWCSRLPWLGFILYLLYYL